MENAPRQERELILTIADDGDAPEEYLHRHRHHRRKKKMSKGKKSVMIVAIVLASLLVLGAIAAFAAYTYLFGKLEYDRSLEGKTDKELGIRLEDNMVIRRGDSSVGNTVSFFGDVSQYEDAEKVPIGGISLDDLPEDVLALLDLDSTPVTSYLKDGADQIQTFVIFGTDKENSVGTAADAVILVSRDPIHKKIKLISIARDTYAYVPERGSYTKLAWTHFLGGVSLTIHTLNSNLYLNLRDYIEVNITKLPTLVDMLGGIEVTLTQVEADYLTSIRPSSFTEGVNHLDGDDVATFVRIRKSSSTDGDVSRTGRQRQVLTALLNKAKTLGYTDYPSLIREGLGLCTTSFGSSEITDLVLDVVTGDYTVESYNLPNDLVPWKGAIIHDLYYSIYNKAYASDAIYRVIYEDLYISGYDNETGG